MNQEKIKEIVFYFLLFSDSHFNDCQLIKADHWLSQFALTRGPTSHILTAAGRKLCLEVFWLTLAICILTSIRLHQSHLMTFSLFVTHFVFSEWVHLWSYGFLRRSMKNRWLFAVSFHPVPVSPVVHSCGWWEWFPLWHWGCSALVSVPFGGAYFPASGSLYPVLAYKRREISDISEIMRLRRCLVTYKCPHLDFPVVVQFVTHQHCPTSYWNLF